MGKSGRFFEAMPELCDNVRSALATNFKIKLGSPVPETKIRHFTVEVGGNLL